MTGAGGGGCIIALTDNHSVKKVMKAVRGYEAFVSNIEHRGVIVE
jgi:galactokinase